MEMPILVPAPVVTDHAAVFRNTLMIQHVSPDEGWWERMTPRDLQALTPLIYTHTNP